MIKEPQIGQIVYGVNPIKGGSSIVAAGIIKFVVKEKKEEVYYSHDSDSQKKEEVYYLRSEKSLYWNAMDASLHPRNGSHFELMLHHSWIPVFEDYMDACKCAITQQMEWKANGLAYLFRDQAKLVLDWEKSRKETAEKYVKIKEQREKIFSAYCHISELNHSLPEKNPRLLCSCREHAGRLNAEEIEAWRKEHPSGYSAEQNVDRIWARVDKAIAEIVSDIKSVRLRKKIKGHWR